ncbi:MAG: ester cyclase [Actinomycetota bacterium]
MADLKDLNRRFYKEVFENRNVDAIDELLAENAVEHEQPPPGVEMKPGREGVKEFIKAYLEAFGPFSVQIHEMYQDGDTVITRATFTATHKGTFGGIPATGKTASVQGIDIVRFEGDRMAEHWGQLDVVGMLTQLGVIPPMG